MQSGASVLEQSPYARAAPELIRLGYHPLPIIPSAKMPGKFESGQWRAMFEWQKYRDRRPTEFERSLWARNYPDANVGVVLGSEAGHDADGVVTYLIAVDIDVDDPDSFDELVRQLPHSPMRKKGAKGETRFYRSPKEIRSKPYNRASDKKRLVDVLTGFDTRQTVVPPSIHPDTGRPYVWIGSPTPAADLPMFDADALEKLEEALSALGWDPNAPGPVAKSAPVRAYTAGDADDIWSEVKAAALANLDAWVPELGIYGCRRARSGYEAVAHWRPSSTGRSLEDRKRNLSIQPNGITDFGTAEGYSAIDLVMAAMSVDQPAATAWLRERLGLADAEVVYLPPVQAALAPSVAPAPVSDQSTSRVDLTELPDALTRVPGLLGEITDWIAATSRRPQRGLALGAALTVLGTASGRKYAGPTRTATHLFILGLARTSAGKDHALQQIGRLMTSAGMAQHIGPSQFMSMQALVKRMIRSPLTLCPMDEFGAFLARINNRKASVYERAITGVLRTAWGASFQTMPVPEWSGQEFDPIHAPALSIYGVSTPEEFYDSLAGADVHNGFLNRFLLFSTRKRPAEREPKADPHVVPEEVRQGLQRVYGSGSALISATSHSGQADAPLISATWADPAAAALYRQFGKDVEDRESEMAYLARTVEMSQRLATIRALGVRPDAPRITVDDMAWGRDVALWSAERMMAETADYLADTQNQADAQRVLRVLKERGQMQHGALLLAMKHRLRAKDFKDLITGLVEAGAVIETKVPTTGGGPVMRLYQAG